MIFWLRNETKPHEMRKILPPGACKKLVDAGHEVRVEKSTNCIYDDREYESAGFPLVDSGSWETAPKEAIILGLKELPEGNKPLIHRHVYFAHAYKGQPGWSELLSRFKSGDGKLFDLEYLVDENNRRVSAFGYWAGYVGAALGFKLQENPQAKIKDFYRDQSDLNLGLSKNKFKTLIIGALGRSGNGAKDFLNQYCDKLDLWDLEETKKGGPFPEILNYDLVINCVLANRKIPPFVTQELIDKNTNDCLIVDVSCDPGGEFNTLPIYQSATKINSPTVKNKDVSILAIDNLPSLLPRESSEDFSEQLLPFLLEMKDDLGVWGRSLNVFEQHIRSL